MRPPRRKPVEHKDISSRGGSRAWARMVARVVREEPVCWLRLPGVCTLRSQTADHVILRKHRPDLSMVRGNLRGACRACNLKRGTTPAHELPALRARCASQQRAKASKAMRFFG